MESDAGNAESKGDLAWADSSLGDALAQTGDVETGLNYLTDAEKIFNEISSADVENVALQLNGSRNNERLKKYQKSNK